MTSAAKLPPITEEGEFIEQSASSGLSVHVEHDPRPVARTRPTVRRDGAARGVWRTTGPLATSLAMSPAPCQRNVLTICTPPHPARPRSCDCRCGRGQGLSRIRPWSKNNGKPWKLFALPPNRTHLQGDLSMQRGAAHCSANVDGCLQNGRSAHSKGGPVMTRQLPSQSINLGLNGGGVTQCVSDGRGQAASLCQDQSALEYWGVLCHSVFLKHLQHTTSHCQRGEASALGRYRTPGSYRTNSAHFIPCCAVLL
ncbi:hypothetical protein JZ751_028714 [Albula glossodonta]|uniref:Uncharacterized protein n=1 Tax=Albula glossodonta TaxID=121402 RepID=A0A8T2NAE9_9TELE|nr:hypothetical protein JZ751_028714 [Albula glossodonta]